MSTFAASLMSWSRVPSLCQSPAMSASPMVGSIGLTTLIVCRIILGAGEGPAFSVAAHAIYKWFPDEKRTLPTAILSQGSAFGVVLAVPALNWIIVHHTWHYAFGALGIVGLMWVVAWLVWGKEGPLTQTAAMAAAEPRIPYFQLLTSRTFIGCCAATFGAYWALSLGLTWFTSFIITGLGFSQQQAGWISILPWVFGAVIVLGGAMVFRAGAFGVAVCAWATSVGPAASRLARTATDRMGFITLSIYRSSRLTCGVLSG